MSEQFNSNSLNEIKKLSIAERILLVEDIWDSISATDEQQKELDSRLEAYKNNPENSKPWKEVRDNIKSRYEK